MDNVTIFASIAGIPAIVALVNAVKRIKDFGPYNVFLAVALGIALQMWLVFTMGTPTGQEVSIASGVGLLTGLAASGLYDALPGDTLKK